MIFIRTHLRLVNIASNAVTIATIDSDKRNASKLTSQLISSRPINHWPPQCDVCEIVQIYIYLFIRKCWNSLARSDATYRYMFIVFLKLVVLCSIDQSVITERHILIYKPIIAIYCADRSINALGNAGGHRHLPWRGHTYLILNRH